MLSISRGTGNPDGRRAGGRGARGWFAVSVGVNVVVLGLFLRALTLHERWYEQFTRRSGAVPASGSASSASRRGRPLRPAGAAATAARRARRAPARPTPRFVRTDDRERFRRRAPRRRADSGQTVGAAEGRGGSGEIIGDGGPTAGMRPTYADPRLWRRPDVAVSAPKSAKERVDSVIADRFGPVRDSIAAAQEIAAGQRKPGDWTVKGAGGTWGMDPQSIHLGKIKVPTALLGLLTTNLQKNLRSNPNELANERRLAQARQEIMDHAASGMAEDDFRGACAHPRAQGPRTQRAPRRAAARRRVQHGGRRRRAALSGAAAAAAPPHDEDGRLRTARPVRRSAGPVRVGPPRRGAPPAAGRLLDDGGDRGCRAGEQVAVDQRAEDAGNHAEHGEVVVRAHADVALLGVRRLEEHAVRHALVRLHRGLLAQPRRDDVAVPRLPRGRDEHVVAVVDAAPDHAVALHPERERVLARHEPAVERQAAVAVLGQERRLAGVDASVVRQRLHARRALVADDAHAARARRVALDVALLGERVEQVRHRLRRLDAELFPISRMLGWYVFSARKSIRYW
jgi:hypothetical protein